MNCFIPITYVPGNALFTVTRKKPFISDEMISKKYIINSTIKILKKAKKLQNQKFNKFTSIIKKLPI